MRGQEEGEMRIRLSGSVGASPGIASGARVSCLAIAVAIAAATAIVALPVARTSAQSPSLKTPWGDPDLQGIWTVEYDTPLQRSARFADQEFFTDAQREEFDRIRSQPGGR